MILEIPIKPFPAKRVNGRWWRFTKTAIDCHSKMNALRTYLLPHRQEIIDHLVYWDYTIQFHFAMAKSWSIKKKEEKNWTPHDDTPDIDNLFKAFTDTVFYGMEDNDKKIWHISASKHWSKEDKIVFIAD